MDTERISIVDLKRILEAKLPETMLPHQELIVDIVDIYESARNYINLINSVINNNTKKEQLEDIFVNIETEIEHIIWHYQNYKANITKL